MAELRGEREGSAVWKQLEHAQGEIAGLKAPIRPQGLERTFARRVEEEVHRLFQAGVARGLAAEGEEEDEDDQEPPRKRRRTDKGKEPAHQPRSDGDDDDEDDDLGGGPRAGHGVVDLAGETQVQSTSQRSQGSDTGSRGNGVGSSGQKRQSEVVEEVEDGEEQQETEQQDEGEVQQQDDFGDVPQALQDALGEVQFPAAFDKKAFAAALKDAAQKGKKNKKAKMPAD